MTVVAEIPSSVEVAAATNAGRPVIVSAPEHILSVSVTKLASALSGEMVNPFGTAPQDSSEPEGKSRRSRRRR
jgi:pilus assembly protein CpaE